MSKIENTEREIQKLTPSELKAFRRGFREYDSDKWDRQIEEKVRAGKPDQLAQEALAEHRAGKSRSLETFCCSDLLSVGVRRI